MTEPPAGPFDVFVCIPCHAGEHAACTRGDGSMSCRCTHGEPSP